MEGNAQGSGVESVDLGRVVTLQVRSSDGRQVLLLKMLETDTVGAVHEIIKQEREDGKSFELRTAFPNKAYDDMGQTLQEAGLAPNATLLLRQSAS